jgi:hypothetical protein
MEAVTRRTCPEIQTLNRCGVVVAAIPFVDVDAASFHAGELLHVGDHGAKRVPVEGIAMQGRALAWSTNCPPFGDVTGVAILTLQPNS